MPGSTALIPLLSDPVFQACAWGRSHTVWRRAVEPSAFITAAEVSRLLDASLLRWPYFTVLHNGAQPPANTYTRTRTIIGQRLGGFPDAAKIRRLIAGGAALKLNQLSDWHRPTRDVRRAIEDILPVAVASYVFWAPAEAHGMLPHRDSAHVIVIQLEGGTEWNLYATPEQIASTATCNLTMDPGDVLYVPHGWTHDALARDCGSIHLTFTLTEPMPEDLVKALLKRFCTQRTELVHRHHARTLESKSAEVRAELAAEAGGFDAEQWLGMALTTMRETMG